MPTRRGEASRYSRNYRDPNGRKGDRGPTMLHVFVFLGSNIICRGTGIAQSVFRLATGWKVRGSNPGGEARFTAPVQTDPGARPASYAMGTGCFPGVIRPGRGGDHPHPFSAEVKEIVVIPLLPLWAFVGCV